ncbi:Hypothetical predicted protein [Paramuricea clavata]|uniref:Pcf11 C-terminal domain-containing protein n=1 Tax=Paramuricea clavata TaxID=317549 RepID=A0A7D9DUN2_PARCT|nr:Hypothetical predicted protein [Paramuricea clavata]
MELHRGTQCSSCGLRFKEANNENYRQHLDWHFRMNRKEKETVAAHRSWFITTDDWLEFESSEDPKLKARSAVFEAESEGESEKSEDLQEGSCPVLIDDNESERQCDICFEKFETFWDETSEDWHYKNAVRVDGKTYHYLCYQDAKEAGDSDVEASDERENTEDNEDDNNDTSENNEAVTIGSSITDDKPSIVTQDTTLESGVDSVVQGSDELAVNNSNKEEIKTESS